MASKRNPTDPVYRTFLRLRAEAWRRSGVKLTELEYMSSIDPARKYTQSTAKQYLNKLATGEWTSRNVLQRSKDAGGRIYNIMLKDDSGQVVDSINMKTVKGVSLYELIEAGTLRQQIENAMEIRYHERSSGKDKRKKHRRQKDYDEDADFGEDEDDNKEGIDSPPRPDMEGLEVAGFKPVRFTRKKNTQVLRP